MREYGIKPIPRPLPRYDGDKHYDESDEVADSELVKRIADIQREHKVYRDWYDEQRNETQFLCTCRTWVYDHATHVAKHIAEVLEKEMW